MSEPVSPQALAERLKMWIRGKSHGRCMVLSMGEECQCPLCDVDRLAAQAAAKDAEIEQLQGYIAARTAPRQGIEPQYDQSDVDAFYLATENRELRAEIARLKAALPEIVRLLGCVRVLDCGAHYCRYCRACSPEWEHGSCCPYVESQKDYEDSRRLIAALRAHVPAHGEPE